MFRRGLVVLGLAAAVLLGGLAGRPEAEAQFSPEVVAWARETGILTKMTQETIDDFVDAGEDVLATNGSERALAELYAETGVFEAVYSAMLDIEPPALVEPAHDEMVMGFELLAEAAPVARRGFLFMDAETISEASGLIADANGHLALAAELLSEAVD